jgi:hypothetical protein
MFKCINKFDNALLVFPISSWKGYFLIFVEMFVSRVTEVTYEHIFHSANIDFFS